MVIKPELQDRNGTAPAPGAVFRALAENTCGEKWCGSQETVAGRKRWPRGRVQQRPGRACSPVGLSAAFTLVDLLAVIGVLAIGFALLTPALARTQPNSKTFQCLNNLRQLGRAWLMYADDNADKLVQAYHGFSARGGAITVNDPNAAPWALGWLDWSSSSDNTKVLLLTDDRYSKLAKYLDHSSKVFKCPSDQFISTAQRAAGFKERVRSVSGNIGLGEGNAEAGPWDASTYLHIKTMSGFQFPGPAGTWVFLDENADSINDPGFFNPRDAWLDFPATYHNGATSFAFADGHAELHKWKASMSDKSYQGPPVWNEARPGPPTSATDVDIGWMRYHGGRISDDRPTWCLECFPECFSRVNQTETKPYPCRRTGVAPVSDIVWAGFSGVVCQP